MAKVKVLAGDFEKSVGGDWSFGKLSLRPPRKFFSEDFDPVKDIDSVGLAGEEEVTSAFGAATWGIVGGLALGGVGVLAGALLGGKKNRVQFVVVLKDGRKVLAEADSKVFKEIQAARF